MALRLYDSLSRELRPVAPADGKVFRMYCCGPTVYGPAHIGNFRTFIVQDVLRRVLELEGRTHGWTVKHVRNLTDVDDKTIRRSREENRSLAAITKHWTDKFHADSAALNCLPPQAEPAATAHIGEQIEMIVALERTGHAYRTADGSVYFKVSSFPEYGRLSRVKERELQPGAALKSAAADADEKEDGSDFALWKAWKPEDGDVGWDSPWGRGRPGWHIECSAMSRQLLGDTIDLHAGGVDLLFPHHENEIAQSEACTGHTFARHWFHTEHLLVDGKKMSKSLGNLYTLDDLVAKGFSPMAVRYTLLAGHPRKQLNFTLESLHAAESALRSLRQFRESLLLKFRAVVGTPPSSLFDGALDALRDDLNIPAALGALFSIINKTDPTGMTVADFFAFEQFGSVLGFELSAVIKVRDATPDRIIALAEQRWAAKKAKDFKTADTLRAELTAAGWSMLDGKDGYKLEPLKR